MRKSLSANLQTLRQLERQRRALLRRLLLSEPLLKGSLSHVKRTCGKPTCHCARRPAHPVWVLATSSNSHRRCQVVRQADVQLVQRRLAAYRQFKEALRSLQAMERRQKALLLGLRDSRAWNYE